MLSRGIKYNDLHSYDDLNLTLKEKEIGDPKKEKALVKVPFSDVEYDFSELYGDQNMSNRQLKYTFNVYDVHKNTVEQMARMKRRAINHFMQNNQMIPLYDDDYPGWHFLAEVREAPSFTEDDGIGQLEVEFEAYKFMIANEKEGNDIWDTFDFEFDTSQTVKMDIGTYKQVILVNNSSGDVSPSINCSSDMIIEYNNITYFLNKGLTNDPDFRLTQVNNYLDISGDGTIEFIWSKEMI